MSLFDGKRYAIRCSIHNKPTHWYTKSGVFVPLARYQEAWVFPDHGSAECAWADIPEETRKRCEIVRVA